MRLFAGIYPSAEALPAITDVGDILRRSLSSKASWTPADKLHLTLRFFGDFDPTEAERVVGHATEVASCFTLSLVSLGGFPNSRRACVVFLQPEANSILEQLAEAMAPTGEPAATPHLTLARFRRPAAIPAIRFEPITFRVREVLLVDSVLGGDRKDYRIRRRWDLQA